MIPSISQNGVVASSEASDLTDEQTALLEALLLRQEASLLEVCSTQLMEMEGMSDPLDMSSQKNDLALASFGSDRARRQLKAVRAALERFQAGEYGYCVVTGEPIGFDRLLAQPTALLSFAAQARKENSDRLCGPVWH